MTETAQGYKQQVVAQAEGESQRFLSILTEYEQAKDVTRTRLYLETMEKVFQSSNKIILESGSGVLPYLPLDQLQRNRPLAPTAAPTASSVSNRAESGSRTMRKASVALIGVLIVAVLLYSSIFIVNPREQALVLRFGEITRVIQKPGIYFKLPTNFVDTVQIIENRLLSFDLEDIRVLVRDGRRYIVDAFVAYKITDPRKFRENVSGSIDHCAGEHAHPARRGPTARLRPAQLRGGAFRTARAT